MTSAPSGHHRTARSVAAHFAATRALLAPLASAPLVSAPLASARLASGQPASDARTEQLPLRQALGRGLVRAVTAPISLPPFANSQMDGYAVRATDIPDDGAQLAVVAPVPAGATPQALAPGTAAPIMTGAMMPPGADAVVPIEQAVPSRFPAPGEETSVRLPSTQPGTFVRPAGSDVQAGEQALPAGSFLGPAQLGLLSGLGITDVSVHRKVTVLLVTTGDEVVEPGRQLPAGKIYDSNGILLESAMRQAGLAVQRAGIANDDPLQLRQLLRARSSDVDLIVTTGGVSQGAYEVVRQAMDGELVEFVHVAMQPGGPQGIGTFEGTPFLGFPGNPVSSLVSFEMFLRPVLAELLGSPAPRIPLRARLAESLSSPEHKHQVRRGNLQPDGSVRLAGGESSHLMHALAASNVLVHVPEGVTGLQAGDEVEVWIL